MSAVIKVFLGIVKSQYPNFQRAVLRRPKIPRIGRLGVRKVTYKCLGRVDGCEH